MGDRLTELMMQVEITLATTIINIKLWYKVNKTPCQWEGVNKQGLVTLLIEGSCSRGNLGKEM